MKKYILFFLVVCLLSLATAYVCQDDTDDDFMPCEVVTPSIEGSCTAGGYNSSVTMINDTNWQGNYTMSSIGDGTYNFSLNISKGIGFNDSLIGYSFGIVSCENSSSTINIVQAEDKDINIWLVIFIIFFLLFIFGFIFHEEAFIGDILLFCAGAEMLIVGIWVFQSGISIYGVSQYWIYPIAWIFVGIGIVLPIYASYHMIEQEELG